MQSQPLSPELRSVKWLDDGESRSATIIMSKDSKILMLDEEDFSDMYENDIKVWRSTSEAGEALKPKVPATVSTLGCIEPLVT